jgi:hypothetical protein
VPKKGGMHLLPISAYQFIFGEINREVGGNVWIRIYIEHQRI